MIDLRTHRARRIALWVFVLALLPTLAVGMRTYGSFRVLQSAYQTGAPVTSSIRGWMTLDYIAAAYQTPKPALLEGLGLPPTTAGNISLATLAADAGVFPPDYVARVQRAIVQAADHKAAPATAKSSNWFASLADETLTALLVYGYPVLGLTLLLGSIGLPLPDGIATAVAGSLAIGRLLGAETVIRHGRWFGYSPKRRAQAQSLFDQWGLLTVFITRTFVSYLSSIASLLAGIARYRLTRFLGIAFAGRVIWAGAYLGLGAAVGSDLEAASGFLASLSILLLLLTVLTASGLIATGRVPVLAEHHPA
ncbi:MAG: hypothetical protein P8Y53_15420 [Pseudolabrys sp.]